MHGRLGGDSAGGSGATRESDEPPPPNPLIRFLAREMGLFSSLRLCWGKEIVGNGDFAEEMGGTRLGGGWGRDAQMQGPGAATAGNCPAWFAGWREMPSLPSARLRGPRSGPTSETSTGSPRYGRAGHGMGRGGGTQGAKPQRSLHGGFGGWSHGGDRRHP